MTSPHARITQANLEADFHPWHGDCASIAVAIHEEFGGRYVAISDTAAEPYLTHVTVEIDGNPYDGKGRVMWSDLLDVFVSPTRQSPPDDHIFYPDKTTITANSMYDEDVKEAVAAALDTASPSL